MDFNKRTKVDYSKDGFQYTPPQANRKYLVASLTCTAKDKTGGRVNYNPEFEFKPVFLGSSIKPEEKQRIIEAARERGETLTIDMIVEEIITALGYHNDASDLSFDHDQIPKEWLKPIKCFDTYIYVTAEYGSSEIDIRAKKPLKVGKAAYVTDEEIGDFIISFVTHLFLHVEYRWNKDCCPEEPEETPKIQKRTFEQSSLLTPDQKKAKNAEKKKKKFETVED
ncbi:MAG: hypothetical protein AAF429_02130 [Pseudomonadota bacterium]